MPRRREDMPTKPAPRLDQAYPPVDGSSALVARTEADQAALDLYAKADKADLSYYDSLPENTERKDMEPIDMMALREYAQAALAGILARVGLPNPSSLDRSTLQTYAKNCFDIAEVMLEEERRRYA